MMVTKGRSATEAELAHGALDERAQGEGGTVAEEQGQARHLTLDLGRVLRYFQHKDPQMVEAARREFLFEVSPVAERFRDPAQDDTDVLERMFGEWFMYDYNMGAGTPLELYADLRPEDLTDVEAFAFEDLAATQFFSHFWVYDQDPVAGTALLCEAVDRVFIPVVDSTIATHPSWQEGLLSVRLARIADGWHVVGQMPMHDTAPRRPDRASVYRGTGYYLDQIPPAADEHWDFIVMARELVGDKGGLRNARIVDLK